MIERPCEPFPEPGLSERRKAEITEALAAAREAAPPLSEVIAYMNEKAGLKAAYYRGEASVAELNALAARELPGIVLFETPEELGFALREAGLSEAKADRTLRHEQAHAAVLEEHGIEVQFGLRLARRWVRRVPAFAFVRPREWSEASSAHDAIMLEAVTAPDRLSPQDKIVAGVK